MRHVEQTSRRMISLSMPRIELLDCRITRGVVIDRAMEVRIQTKIVNNTLQAAQGRWN